MIKQGTKMQNKIKEYNEIQVEERKDLPNLIEMIRLTQSGDMKVFNLYFYGYKTVERYPYGGKMQSYEVNKVKFWDKPTDIFLSNMKKKYTKDVAVGEANNYSGRKITYKVNVSNFEEAEIDELFYSYMIELVGKIKLENFEKETEAKTLNAIRKYIRYGFENRIKKVGNDKIQLERVRVDGNLYYVKNKQEEVFFEDIYIGKDEDGNNLQFLDTVGYDDIYDTGLNAIDLTSTSKKFIEENLEDVLTKKQYEKWLLLLEHVKNNGIESILDKYTGKIVKAKVQRIIYPDKNYKNIERVDSLIKIMNQRMEKALDGADMSYISLEDEEAKHNKEVEQKSGKVEIFTGGLTEEEVERYFKNHLEGILRAFAEGRLTFDKGTNGMLPSFDSMLELPFDVYEKFKNGGMKTRMEVIKEYYNPEKFKLRAGKKEVIKEQKGKEFEDKNSKYITPEQLKEIRRRK